VLPPHIGQPSVGIPPSAIAVGSSVVPVAGRSVTVRLVVAIEG